MKRRMILLMVILLLGPIGLAAAEDRPGRRNDIGEKASIARARNEEMRRRLNLPVRLPIERDAHHHHRKILPLPDYRYPYPASQTTVVKELQPIIVVTPAPPEKPPASPEIQYVWVPPVTEMRTEPGHWDYGIKKEWMGDHWRYSQDLAEKTWIPETRVEAVKQPGYWNIVR